MRRFSNPLDRVSVAAPCPANWDAMIGDERIRFCNQCELNVYNLSAMSRRDAEALIAGTEGRLCVRYYRRKDGSIITEDCPVGLRRLKSRAMKVRRALGSALLGFLAGVGIHGVLERFGSFLEDVPIGYRHTMGVMVEPPVTGQMIAPPVQGGMIMEPPTVGRLRPRTHKSRSK
jgi:hypothetical protein